MPETGPATPRRTRPGASYANQWNRLLSWSQVSARRSPPSSSEDVAAYDEDRSDTGARPYTLRVMAVATVCNHEAAGFEVPIHHGVARAVLDEVMRDHAPGPGRALPLDLDCYLAIRKRVPKPRWGRSGRMDRTESVLGRGAIDIIMINLMRDGG